MRLRNLLAASCIALAAAMPASAATIYVTTGDANANDPVSTDNPRLWSFSVPAASGWSFGGGFFNMKVGSQSSIDYPNAFVKIDLYLASAPATSLGSFAYSTINAFETSPYFGGVSGYRDNIPFQFTTPVVLVDGAIYNVVMSSDVPTGGSTQFFIKTNGTLDVITDTNALPPTIEVPPTTDTPEPASALALATGLMALGAVRRRKRARAVAATA